MENSNEKIKEFFSDKSKVKGLVNDEAFMKKISGGTATPETYREKFKSLGLELNEKESKEISKDVKILLSATPEELKDISLENVSGGSNSNNIGIGIGIGGGVLGLGGLATWLVTMSLMDDYDNEDDGD